MEVDEVDTERNGWLMDDKTFKFAIGQEIAIACSGEVGTIIGRAEYAESADAYFVRYRAGDGRAVEAWWAESALILLRQYAADRAPDPNAGGAVDRSVAAEPQNVGDDGKF